MSNLEKDIMEKTMKKALEMVKEKGSGNITKEDMMAAAMQIAEEAGIVKDAEPEKQEGEIAGGIAENGEEIIGGGIMAEPEPEPEMAKGEEEPDDYIIRFSEPYCFEGKSYAGVDLSGMQSLRAKDIWKIDRNYRNAGNLGILKEMDNEYTCRVAAAASGMPVEFFMGMALADMVKVRTKVSDFFYPKE